MTFCLHLPLTSADWTSLVAAIIKWLLLRDDHWTFLYMLSSWWYEPMWKNLQLGNLPQISGWQKTYLKPSPRCFSMLCLYFGALSPFEYDTNSCSDFLGDQKGPKKSSFTGEPWCPPKYIALKMGSPWPFSAPFWWCLANPNQNRERNP